MIQSGIFVYAVLNTMVFLIVFISGGRIEPREYDLKEYWTWKGSGRAPWFVRAMRNRHRMATSRISHGDFASGHCSTQEFAMSQYQHTSSVPSSAKDEPSVGGERPGTPTPGSRGF